MVKQINRLTFVTSIVLFLISLYVATQCRFTEIDEVYFADAPANLLLNGGWKSHILWGQFFYQPLHAFLLIPWMFVLGVSHFSVCGFGVFWGLITCLLLVKYAKDLGFIDKTWQEILVVIGFWALNTFTDYETFGRPDNLGMLITVIVVYHFLRHRDIGFWRCLLLGMLLVSVGLYEIPAMALFFAIVILLSIRDKKEVWMWIKKGVYFVIGIIAGYIIVCVFYFFNESSSVTNFIGYCFGMNAIVSSKMGLLGRFWEAYLGNWYITLILLITLLLLIIRRIQFNKVLAIALLLIPAVMTLAGRFVTYYLWIYYIPWIIFIVYTLKEKEKLATIPITLFVVASLVFFAVQWNHTFGHQTGTIKELTIIKKNCKRYFENNKDLIAQYHNVVLSEEQFYYDIINLHSEVWFQYRKNITQQLDFYNYEAMERSLKPAQQRNALKYINKPVIGNVIKSYLDNNPIAKYFPEEGICIYTCDYEKTTSMAFMDHFGYKYECLDSQEEFSIYQFSKK